MESAEQAAARARVAREAARRRQAVTMLQITECTCRYGASVLANGSGPAEARAAALEVAGELAVVAEALRRLARLSPAERRQQAARLRALGLSQHQVAVQLGISDRQAQAYLARPRPGTLA